MKIDLRQARVLVISCVDQQDRRRHIQSQLARLEMGSEFVDGIRCRPGIIGCALSHLKILTSYADALPLVVLEDDCSAAKSFVPVLDIPDAADIAYLGVSTWGVFPDVHPSGINMASIATRYNPHWLRLHNMVSTHALVYLTPALVRAARDAIVRHLVENRPFDMGFALLQRKFMALTPNEPCFFQDAKFGGAEKSTRQRLIPVDNLANVQVTRSGNKIKITRPMPVCRPIQ